MVNQNNAVLVKVNSDDTGSATLGGDLGFFDNKTMVPEFTAATWAMNVGDISAPVKTDYGYHIIQLQDIKEKTSPSLAELDAGKRTELETEFKLQKVEGLLSDRADELAQQVFDANDVLQGVAEANKLQLKTQLSVGRNTYSGIAAEPAIKTAIFSEELLDGTNSDLIAVNNDHAVFLRVTDFREPRQKSLEEVSVLLRSQLEQQAAANKATEAGVALQAEVATTQELKSKADAASYAFTQDLTIKRNQPGVQSDLLTAAFQAGTPNGEAIEQGVDLSNGDYAIFYLQEVKKADANLTDTEKEARFTSMANQIGGVELNAYLNSLKEGASIVYPVEQEE